MSDTRTIKILKSTVCTGRPVKAGDVVDASLEDAWYLVNTGAAEPFVEEEKPKAARKTNKMVNTKELEARDAGE